MRRVQVLSQQICSSQTLSDEDIAKMSPGEKAAKFFENFKIFSDGAEDLRTNGTSPPMTMFELIALQTRFQNREDMPKRFLVDALSTEAKGSLDVCQLLSGPLRNVTSQDEKIAMLHTVDLAMRRGTDVYLWAKWQLEYGDRGLASNIAVPVLIQQKAAARVIVADPEDAERIARTHVRKDGSFEPILFDSVIATVDNEFWRVQRQHLAEVFMPLSSLAKILPVSAARAKLCAERLAVAAAAGPVDISDFFLHEAQAQLQLALLGLPEEFMDATNADIRHNFMATPDAPIGKLSEAMAEVMKRAKEDQTLALPSDPRPVHGPLSRALQTSPDVGVGPAANYGNALLILFAGHDTTGHCMTWLLLELCRHPEYQRELQREVDAYFEMLDGREPTYEDLGQLSFLDRCITETLRLWNSVPNGTFRQLQFDDHVKGEGGKDVLLPKGTFVQVLTWSRHRNPDLWGPDVDEWNPHRHFEPGELTSVAGGCPMAAKNPQSARFSPFVHAPRSCLGRNFAQMEMHLIIPQLLRKLDFSLAPPYDRLQNVATGSTIQGADHDFRGCNRGTMGPLSLEPPEMPWGKIYNYALKLNVRPRSAVV